MHTASIRGPIAEAQPTRRLEKFSEPLSLERSEFQVQYSTYLLIIALYPGETQMANKCMKLTNLTNN